mmetsp:Transcript_7389/g.14553  ORF Transcript_7389/g.14553 Transcript_7389/m.14553 type:complete len:332 (-) Transcript_7389:162-1157(-)
MITVVRSVASPQPSFPRRPPFLASFSRQNIGGQNGAVSGGDFPDLVVGLCHAALHQQPSRRFRDPWKQKRRRRANGGAGEAQRTPILKNHSHQDQDKLAGGKIQLGSDSSNTAPFRTNAFRGQNVRGERLACRADTGDETEERVNAEIGRNPRQQSSGNGDGETQQVAAFTAAAVRKRAEEAGSNQISEEKNAVGQLGLPSAAADQIKLGQDASAFMSPFVLGSGQRAESSRRIRFAVNGEASSIRAVGALPVVTGYGVGRRVEDHEQNDQAIGDPHQRRYQQKLELVSAKFTSIFNKNVIKRKRITGTSRHIAERLKKGGEAIKRKNSFY